ncbi:hypothetical protein CXF43_10355, partial [Corynebacterium bovis]|uniref:hypothetical protein n=1 Tax=Corynebacterium bovis TaxID=36808 RepID=UPI000F9A4647
SILKIMAGLDQPSNGEAFLDPGATVGILQQEPPLNEDKTVRHDGGDRGEGRAAQAGHAGRAVASPEGLGRAEITGPGVHDR